MLRYQFATAINCIDGRTQLPLISWARREFNVGHLDMITEPGAVKMLNQGNTEEVEKIKQKVALSVNAHRSRLIIIAGHHDCAANPMTENDHRKQIGNSVKLINSWQLPAQVIGVWIDENWHVQPILNSSFSSLSLWLCKDLYIKSSNITAKGRHL